MKITLFGDVALSHMYKVLLIITSKALDDTLSFVRIAFQQSLTKTALNDLECLFTVLYYLTYHIDVISRLLLLNV